MVLVDVRERHDVAQSLIAYVAAFEHLTMGSVDLTCGVNRRDGDVCGVVRAGSIVDGKMAATLGPQWTIVPAYVPASLMAGLLLIARYYAPLFCNWAILCVTATVTSFAAWSRYFFLRPFRTSMWRPSGCGGRS